MAKTIYEAPNGDGSLSIATGSIDECLDFLGFERN
jgi:hypothetical protein